MQRVRLIHWQAETAQARAEELRAAGYEVEAGPLSGAGLRALRAEPPDAIVIDLSRSPSQGRDLGLNLRTYTATRHVPLVYVEGNAEKVARIQELLPDAVYTSWDGIGPALAEAIAHPPAEPVVPSSVFAAYAGTPLPKKLGIAKNAVVALVDAPKGFAETLGALPPDAVLQEGAGTQAEVTLWFTRSRAQLEAGIEAMGASAGERRLWILWPKKASGIKSDLSQVAVREVGLAAGLVDYKVCAVDEVWSGLLFTRRKS